MATTAASPGSIDLQWWRHQDAVLWERVLPIAKGIRQRQQWRQQDLLNFARLYGGKAFEQSLRHNILALAGGEPPSISSLPRVALNIIKSIVDTAVAKLSTIDVKATVLTDGGSFDERQQAEDLDEYVEAVLYAAGMRSLAPQILTDAGVFDAGVVKVYEQDGEVKVERTLSMELFVDELDGQYGQPRQLLQRKGIDKGVLVEMFPKHADAIRKARVISRDDGNSTYAEMVEIWEAWHLPSGPDAKDGRHCIVIDGCTLFAEKWERKNFPFVFLRWSKRLAGFWGFGLAESLVGLQVEINRLARTIQLSLHLNGVPRVLVENGSEVDVATINNDIGSIISYTGAPPQFIVPSSVPKDLVQQMESLIQKAYELEGISQTGAQSRKSPGLNSGAAIRTEADLQTERFSVKQKLYEEFHLEVARQCIELAASIEKRRKEAGEEGYTLKSPGPRFFKRLSFPERLADLAFELQVYPTNMLPKTPEGRLATIQEYMQANLLSPEEGRMLLDFPDLKSVTGLEDAPLKYALYRIDETLRTGEPAAVDPYMDKPTTLKLAKRAHMRAVMDGAGPTKLGALEAFIDALTADLEANQAGAANAPPPGQPMARPDAQPTSNLLPNVPPPAAPAPAAA